MKNLHDQLSDSELVDLLKQSNHAALAEIYQRYWAVLFIQARKMLQDDDLARDVTQEIFISLWSSGPELKINSNLSGYLYASVRNKVLNCIRDNKVRTDYIDLFGLYLEQSQNSTTEILEEKELRNTILEIVESLPPKMREVFELSRFQHLTHKEIAGQLNISETTVKKQISNALGVLKTKLGDQDALVLALMLLEFRK